MCPVALNDVPVLLSSLALGKREPFVTTCSFRGVAGSRLALGIGSAWGGVCTARDTRIARPAGDSNLYGLGLALVAAKGNSVSAPSRGGGRQRERFRSVFLECAVSCQ
jgi:hypothetical protein